MGFVHRVLFGLGEEEGMRRLYYLAEDLETTRIVSDTLQAEGITNWNFHVLAKDAEGLYQHHIHQATTYQQLDIVRAGERWALLGGGIGFLIGMVNYLIQVLPWSVDGLTVVLTTVVGGLFGAWRGAMVGLARESYKIESFHDEIESGRYLIMVDVQRENKSQVREIMSLGFPNVRFCGRDTTTINPLKRPSAHVYGQIAR